MICLAASDEPLLTRDGYSFLEEAFAGAGLTDSPERAAFDRFEGLTFDTEPASDGGEDELRG